MPRPAGVGKEVWVAGGAGWPWTLLDLGAQAGWGGPASFPPWAASRCLLTASFRPVRSTSPLLCRWLIGSHMGPPGAADGR